MTGSLSCLTTWMMCFSGQYTMGRIWVTPLRDRKVRGSENKKTCLEALAALLSDGASFSEAAEQLKALGFKRNEIYKAKLRLKQLSDEI